MIKELNIDQLHSVIEQIQDPTKKEFIPRQAGMTTAFLYLMLDEVYGGDYNNNYLYICGNYDISLERVASAFSDLLLQENIDNHRLGLMGKKLIIQVSSGQVFQFTDINNVLNENFWHATSYNRVFIDVGQSWLGNIHKEALKYEIRMRGGDCI
jgi:hypothetical protein